MSNTETLLHLSNQTELNLNTAVLRSFLLNRFNLQRRSNFFLRQIVDRLSCLRTRKIRKHVKNYSFRRIVDTDLSTLLFQFERSVDNEKFKNPLTLSYQPIPEACAIVSHGITIRKKTDNDFQVRVAISYNLKNVAISHNLMNVVFTET